MGFEEEAEALMIGPWLMPRQRDNSVPAAPDHPYTGHTPYARPLNEDWTKDATGRWQSGSVDANSWEVICAECGDTDGPVETQSAAVRARRGPYRSKRKAEHAATKHFNGDQ